MRWPRLEPGEVLVGVGPMSDSDESDGCGVGVRQHIADFATCGRSIHTQTDKRSLRRLVETGKRLLADTEQSIVRSADEGTVALKTYSSDGTPVVTTERMSRRLRAKKVTRSARHATEFLVHRSYTQCDDMGGNTRTAINFTEPVPMSHGKSGWCIFAVLLQFCTLLRALGCKGLCISHYIFDGGCFTVMRRLCQKRHSKFYSESASAKKEK